MGERGITSAGGEGVKRYLEDMKGWVIQDRVQGDGSGPAGYVRAEVPEKGIKNKFEIASSEEAMLS
jgi:hypothetical protein